MSESGPMTTLGGKLRDLRVHKKGMALREAAALLQSEPRWLSDVEADRIKPAGGALSDLARVYDVPLTELAPLWSRWEKAPPIDLNAAGVIICRRPL